MTALTAEHLSKSFASSPVLRDVSLAVDLGERVGLVGVNGSGKSTLCRILAGLDEPDDGVVARRRDLGFMYLPQEPELDPALTVSQCVEEALGPWQRAMRAHEDTAARLAEPGADVDALLAAQAEAAATIERLGGWDMRHRVEAILDHLRVARADQRVGELSGGERRRVALARVLVAQPGMAILDEPTNHLDADTDAWLEEWLRDEYRGALLLITHDRYFLDRVATRVVELDRGELFSYAGNYSEFVRLKAERLEHEARTEARRMNLLRREREWLARGPAARTTKQKARIDRAEALEDVVRRDRRDGSRVEMQSDAVRTGKRVVDLEGVTKSAGERLLMRGLDLVMVPGERLGVVGPNGAGKTTLIKMILGEVEPDAGVVRVGQNTRVKYFDQARAGLDESLSVYDNLFEGSDKVYVGGRWMNLHGYLEDFLFDPTKQRQKVASLSGGERARLALAKTLRGEANLLILDEPTNDLDLATLGVLEELLTSWPGCAIVVTHDRWFLDRVATSVLAFEGDGRVVKYAGGWSDHVAQRATLDEARKEAERAARERAPEVKPAKTDAVTPAKKKLTMAEAKELEALPARVDEAEARVRALEETLADPGFYAREGGAVAATMTSLDEARAAVDALMERWESLEARR